MTDERFKELRAKLRSGACNQTDAMELLCEVEALRSHRMHHVARIDALRAERDELRAEVVKLNQAAARSGQKSTSKALESMAKARGDERPNETKAKPKRRTPRSKLSDPEG